MVQCFAVRRYFREKLNVKHEGIFKRRMLTLVLCVDLYFFNIFFRSATLLSSSVCLFCSFRSFLRILSSSANSCLFLATFSCSRFAESVKANPSPVLQSEDIMRKRAENATRIVLGLIFTSVSNMSCMLQTEPF